MPADQPTRPRRPITPREIIAAWEKYVARYGEPLEGVPKNVRKIMELEKKRVTRQAGERP